MKSESEIFPPAIEAVKTAEAWKQAKGTSDWSFAGASAQWPIGKVLTESDYDAAIAAFNTAEIR